MESTQQEQIRVTAENFDALMQEAQREPNGLVVLDFYTDICRPCQTMDTVIDMALAETPSLFRIYKVNAAEEAELVKVFHVTSVPSFFLFKGGKFQKQKSGSCSKKDFLNWVQTP